jgi:hypothetical protein
VLRKRAVSYFNSTFGLPSYMQEDGSLQCRKNNSGKWTPFTAPSVSEGCRAEVQLGSFTYRSPRALMLSSPTEEDFYAQDLQVFLWAPERIFHHRRLSKKLICPRCEEEGGVSGAGLRPTFHEVITLQGRARLLESGFICSSSKCSKAKGEGSSWGSAKGAVAERFMELNFSAGVKEELPVEWTNVNDTYGWHKEVLQLIRVLHAAGVSMDACSQVLQQLHVSLLEQAPCMQSD